MNNIHHQETSHDSLYEDISRNLEIIFKLWIEGNTTLRFSIPILCAVKLEAFINVAGKLKVEHWGILERKLSFNEKCLIVFAAAGLIFDPKAEPNGTAVSIFDIRNSLVHPKMKFGQIDEYISQHEYEHRSGNIYSPHHLRVELDQTKLIQLKNASDLFVSEWGEKLLDGNSQHWLSNSSSKIFTLGSQ